LANVPLDVGSAKIVVRDVADGAGGTVVNCRWSKAIKYLMPALLCGFLLQNSFASESPARTKSRSKKPAPVNSVPDFSPGPLPAVPLDQVPTTAPQVSYQAGVLTINAQNSTLNEVLKAVKAKTGAAIEIPGGANERVVGRFGPGPARDVLALLLNGSHFNYVLLGSPTDPAAVSQVMLMAKNGGGVPGNAGGTGANNAASRPPGPPGSSNPGLNSFPTPNPNAQGEDANDTAEDNQDNNEGNDNNAEAQQQQEEQNGDQAQQAEGQENQQENGQPAQAKTPEQMLQELQQQQQQLQQQQQQQPQPGQPQPFQNPPLPRPPVPRPDLRNN
jgi:hypothetical protein